MADKQIIKLNELTRINQELRLYEQCPYMGDDERCNAHLNEVFWWKCYEFDNCLYKKYKAKEQECERLKEENAEIRKYQYEQDFLQQQLDQLKAENNLLRQTHKTEQDRRRAYENALTEIKEIAKNGCYDDCGMPLDELSIILQKISEVEDET